MNDNDGQYLRLEERRRLRLRNNLLDMLFFLIFSLCLAATLYALRSEDYFLCGKSLEKIFGVHELQTKEHDSFWVITNTQTFYHYMRTTFLRNLYGGRDLSLGTETDRTLSHSFSFMTRESIWVSNGVAILLSVVRLRQQRVKPSPPGDCQTADWIAQLKLSVSCQGIYIDDFRRSTKDTASYGENWESFSSDGKSLGGRSNPWRAMSEADDFDLAGRQSSDYFRYYSSFKSKPKSNVSRATLRKRLPLKPWTYVPAEETGSATFRGGLSSYDGGGYIMDLSRDKMEVEATLRELELQEWIDIRTRAVFIEFTTYNPNLNLFNVHSFVLEKSSFDSFTPSASILTSRFPGDTDAPLGIVFLVGILVVVLLCIVYLVASVTYTFVSRYKALGLKGWKSTWLWLDALFIFSAIFVCAFCVYAYNQMVEKMKLLQNDATLEFINFESCVIIRLNVLYCICFLFVICFFKVWNLVVPSYRKFYVIGMTLSLTGKYVASFSVYLLIALCTFATLGFVSFGPFHQRFAFFWDSVKNHVVITKILGSMPYRNLKEYNRLIGPFYYLCFNFITYYLVVNTVISILTEGLSEAQDTARKRSYKHTYANYFMYKMKELIPRCWVKRMRSIRRARSGQTMREAETKRLRPERWLLMAQVLRSTYFQLLQSPPQLRLQRMALLTERILNPRKQRIIKKTDRYYEMKVRLMKIGPRRERAMNRATKDFIHSKTGHAFTPADNLLYQQFNFQVQICKLNKLLRKLEALAQEARSLPSPHSHLHPHPHPVPRSTTTTKRSKAKAIPPPPPPTPTSQSVKRALSALVHGKEKGKGPRTEVFYGEKESGDAQDSSRNRLDENEGTNANSNSLKDKIGGDENTDDAIESIDPEALDLDAVDLDPKNVTGQSVKKTGSLRTRRRESGGKGHEKSVTFLQFKREPR